MWWAFTGVLRMTGFLPCPQQFEALFHSRDRKGESRQDFVPFLQQLLFQCTRLAPSGRFSKDNLSVDSPLDCSPAGFFVLLLAHIHTFPIC